MSTSPPDDPHLARVLARLQRSETAYRRSDQHAYSRGYLEALRHATLVVSEEMERRAAEAVLAAEPCDNCSDPIDDDVAAERTVYSIGATAYEGLLCKGCLSAPDADTCIKCGGVWWTGATPPHTELNSPGSVCGACWEASVDRD